MFAAYLAFTSIVDPYGVSPLRLTLPGINAVKPKRLAIDRLIKPYEVWRYQPRTVFLGTSRFHQSIDPAVLGGTRFSPAYNAALPATSLWETEALLEEFLNMIKTCASSSWNYSSIISWVTSRGGLVDPCCNSCPRQRLCSSAGQHFITPFRPCSSMSPDVRAPKLLRADTGSRLQTTKDDLMRGTLSVSTWAFTTDF